MLRIGVVSDRAYEASPRVQRLTQALASRGDSISLWTPRASDAPLPVLDHGVAVHRVGAPFGLGVRTRAAELVCALGLVRAHAIQRFDLVLVQGGASLALAGLLPRLTGAALVLDLDAEAVRAHFSPEASATRKQAVALSLSAAGAILVESEAQYRRLIAEGVPARKLSVLPSGVDELRFSPRKKPPRVKDGLPLQIFVSAPGAAWGAASAALGALVEEGLDLSVCRAGPPGSVPAALEGRLERIEDDVDSELFSERLRRAHLALLAPPEDPLAAWPQRLAAMSVGVQSVVLNETVEGAPGVRASAVDPAEIAAQLRALLSDPAGAKARGRSAQEWAEAHRWALSARILDAIVDHQCAPKIRAQRAQAQAAIEGEKTGRVFTPAKPSR